jgi:hypothetical protein
MYYLNDVKGHQNNNFLQEKVLKFSSTTGLCCTEVCNIMSSNAILRKEIQENITCVKLQKILNWTIIYNLFWHVKAEVNYYPFAVLTCGSII